MEGRQTAQIRGLPPVHHKLLRFFHEWSQQTDPTFKGDDYLPMSSMKSIGIHRIFSALISFKFGIEHRDFAICITQAPGKLNDRTRKTVGKFFRFIRLLVPQIPQLLNASCTSNHSSLLALFSKDSNANKAEELRTRWHISHFRDLSICSGIGGPCEYSFCCLHINDDLLAPKKDPHWGNCLLPPGP